MTGPAAPTTLEALVARHRARIEAAYHAATGAVWPMARPVVFLADVGGRDPDSLGEVLAKEILGRPAAALRIASARRSRDQVLCFAMPRADLQPILWTLARLGGSSTATGTLAGPGTDGKVLVLAIGRHDEWCLIEAPGLVVPTPEPRKVAGRRAPRPRPRS